MESNEALIHAILFDGQGGGRELTWAEAAAWTSELGFLWIHLQLDQSDAQKWIEEEGGFDPIVAEALMDEDNHPRIVWEGDTLFGTLRGINFNRQANPEDMVFINLYIDQNRAVTTRTARVMTSQDVVKDLKAGLGPQRPGGFLMSILEHLHDRMEPILGEIEEDLDNHEQTLLSENAQNENMRHPRKNGHS
jgi:zinc transporter